MTKVAIIGTQGVPAKYGGFESLVENIIGENASPEIDYTIFCSSKDMPQKLDTYKGCRLKYVPLRANGIQSIPYDMLSMTRVFRGYDTILVLGTSGCLFLPVLKTLSRKRLVVNIDGLEHRRAKWGKLARFILRASEASAVRFADVIIADNKGIQDYVTETYHKPAALIAYGGDNVIRPVAPERQAAILGQYNLIAGEYAITVCRVEPENNPDIILEAFARTGKPLVFIGNWDRSQFSRSLKAEYERFSNITFLNNVYDLDILFALRNNAGAYVHGHSAGGTNPSLVEAMFFGRPILAYNVVYNRETTDNRALYFSNSNELIAHLSAPLPSGEPLRDFARNNYTWKKIASLYEALY